MNLRPAYRAPKNVHIVNQCATNSNQKACSNLARSLHAKAQGKAAMKLMDKNDDGQIDLAEFMAGGGSKTEFLKCDINGDGVLDEREMVLRSKNRAKTSNGYSGRRNPDYEFKSSVSCRPGEPVVLLSRAGCSPIVKTNSWSVISRRSHLLTTVLTAKTRTGICTRRLEVPRAAVPCSPSPAPRRILRSTSSSGWDPNL